MNCKIAPDVISIRAKIFTVKNKLLKLFQKKSKFLMKTFMVILKANLIKILNNKKIYMLINFLCSKFNDSLRGVKISMKDKYINKVL